MYPWERVEADTDSTLRLVHESVLRGHRTAVLYPKNLTIRNSITSGFCKFITTPGGKVPSNIPTFHKKVQFKEQLVPMSGFDVIFVRNNPPLDPVMLNFLDSVKDDTFIINDINGLRKANNKLYPASFEDPNNEIIPVTHVSKNKNYLKRIIQESEKERMILKPFDGYGGSGVIVLERGAMQNVNSLLDYYITGKDRDHYVILQEYISGAENGDVRVLMLNGEPIGAMKRIPGEGDLRSNVHAGGNAVKHTLTKKEKELCSKIGPKLVSDGLYFVGIDIISNKLIEVNVCSPGGITRINKFNRVKLQQKVLDFAENVVKYKEAAIERKRAFRKTIEDA
jgi:glutathione synthase